MAHLHELLAVEGALKGRATEMINEAMITFTKRVDHFMGHERSYSPFDAIEAEKLGGVEERKELTDTVPSKLKWVQGHVQEYLDAVLQKELTNTTAKADLVVDGVTLAKDLPATFLLSLESKLTEIRRYYALAPTLQPGIDWQPDEQLGEGIYKSKYDKTSFKTKKTVQHKVLVQPTKEHPAQIEKWNEDINVGKITQKMWTGAISVADKANLLNNIDTLIAAAKKARQRANEAEVVSRNIGGELFNFIHGNGKK